MSVTQAPGQLRPEDAPIERPRAGTERAGAAVWPGVRLPRLPAFRDPALPLDLWDVALGRRLALLLLAVCLGYRVVVPALLSLPLVLAPEVQRWQVAVVLTAWAIHNILIVVSWSRRPLYDRSSVAVVVIDACGALAVFATLTLVARSVGAFAPVSHLTDSFGWSALVGTVGLWTWRRGVATASVLVVGTAAVPAVLVCGGVTSDWTVWASVTATHVGGTAFALAAAACVRQLFRRSVGGSHHAGIDVGAARERMRSLRLVHDRAVQTLDGVALLAATSRPQDSAQTLGRVGRLAAAESRSLRNQLRTPWPEPSVIDDTVGVTGRASRPHRTESAQVRDSHGVVRAVERVVDEARDRDQEVRLTVVTTVRPLLQPVVAAAAAGIVHEALTNARKHSGAMMATVGLTVSDDDVQLLIEDDGRGFEPSITAEGFGLSQSVRARARELGGQVSIDSGCGSGTRIRVRLPR
jgi:signal transduction histidine kinase